MRPMSESIRKRILWDVATGLRKPVKLSLHPVITTGFVKLEHFFHANPESQRRPYVVLVAAIVSSSKVHECPRALNDVFLAMMAYCKSVPPQRLKHELIMAALGIEALELREPTEKELGEMKDCEVEILASHGFTPHVSQPLDYTDARVRPFLKDQELRLELFRYQSAFLCSNIFFEYDHEVVALVLTQIVVSGCDEIPQEIQKWIDDVASRHDEGVIETTRIKMEEVGRYLRYDESKGHPKSGNE